MSEFDLVIREGTAAAASVFQTDISPFRCAGSKGTLGAKLGRHISCKANGFAVAVALFPAASNDERAALRQFVAVTAADPPSVSQPD
jgi:hypothetical protein